MSEFNDPWDDPLAPTETYVPPREQAPDMVVVKKPEKRRKGRIAAVLAGVAVAAAGLWIGASKGEAEPLASSQPTVQAAENLPKDFMRDGALDLSDAAQKIGPLPEAVSKNADGIVAVASKNGESSVTLGTGFKLDHDSIITAGHVVKGESEHDPYSCDYTQVRMSIGKTAAATERSAFRGGEGNDAAQVDIDPSLSPGFAELPSLPLADELPAPGTVVYNSSRQSLEERGAFNDPSEPGAMPPSTYAGVVSSINETTGTVEIITGIAPSYSQGLNYNIPGGSGSPWMNESGEVIGVTSGGAATPVWAYNNNAPDRPLRGLSGDQTVGVALAAPLTMEEGAELGTLPPEQCDGVAYPG